MKTIFYFTCLLLLLAGSIAHAQKGPEMLNAKLFETKLKSTSNAVLLDVRTPEEYSEGKIAGAINIDYNNAAFTKKISKLDKDKTYFVYCAKGGRSSKAVEEMNSLGFKSVYNLEGGFEGWKENGMLVK